MTVNVLISTIDDGIEKIFDLLLTKREDVFYTISHQYTDKRYNYLPEKLKRTDVFVSHIPGRGLAKSRNNALRLASGDICLIADDDVRYEQDSFDIIKKTFASREIDVGCFMINTGEVGRPYKKYPATKVKLKNVKQFSPSSIEIAFKLTSILKNGVEFDERFGLGTNLPGGEDKIFINDCIQKRLNVYFFPAFIVLHPYISTTRKLPKYDRNRIIVSGAIDARINGKLAYLKAIAKTVKLSLDLLHHKKNPFQYLHEKLIGIRQTLKTS